MTQPPGDGLNKAAGPAGTGVHPQGRAASEPHAPPGAVRYETLDIKPAQVLKALTVLALVTVVVVAVLYPIFLSFRARQRRTDPPTPPMGQHQPGRRPAEPRLQTTPVDDLAAIRADDERRLNAYGWVDENAGTVHIPITEAMSLLVARGASAPALAAGTPAASPAPSPAVPGAAPAPAPTPAAGGHE